MSQVASSLLDRQSVDVSADKTLAAADSGIVQNVVADNKVITLPATTVGMTFTIRNGGAPVSGGAAGTGSDGSVLVTVSPNASDKIMGFGVAGTDDKDILNTKLTSRVGDEVTLVADGANGWFVQRISGTWAFQA